MTPDQTPTYEFKTQLAIGSEGERRLDEFFADWFVITPASEDEQRMGIDRWFVRRQSSKDGPAGERFAVEYKTDHRAHESGNAFVETVSVAGTQHGKEGWVYSSRARWLIYYVPGEGAEMAYIVPFAKLRAELPRLRRHYPEVPVQNKGYLTLGLVVPLLEFECIARAVVTP